LYKYQNLCETNDPYVFKEKIDEKYLEIKEIKRRMEHGLDIIGRDEVYKAQKIDDSFPKYILQNIKKYKDWIVN